MSKKPETYRMDLECPYGKTITFRRSAVSKKAWEYLVYKFGISQIPPERIQSITIDGEDDFGHLIINIIAERDDKEAYDG